MVTGGRAGGAMPPDGVGGMPQRTFSMTLEVKPASATKLAALIDDLHTASAGKDAQGVSYASFMAQVPSVHFMSMSVFPSNDVDPLFVIEANIDGAPSVFWAQLAAMIGERLRAMIRCCKRPLNQDGPLYDAVTALDSRVGVAPYLEVRSVAPSVFHHGNRGLTRDRIVAEGELFRATRRVLTTDLVPMAAEPVAVHDALRKALAGQFSWLDQPAPVRIGTGERLADIAKLVAFVVLVVVALSLPGLIASPLMPTARFLILLAVALLAVGIPLYRIREPLTDTGVPGPGPVRIVLGAVTRNLLPIALLIGAYLLIVLPVWTIGASLATGLPLSVAWHGGVRIVLLGLLSAVFSVTAILAWLRWLERRDSSHDDPPIDEVAMRQMAQREDWIPQNHMGSIVVVKPGVLRMAIVKAGHLGLHLVLRAKKTEGYLGSMRTVHFAHWAFVNNSSRLMFHSNFDQSWESYLDDFIEKAHAGLTLAWGCGLGFPPTRFLIKDGASHGRRFKAWARHSMAISRFWYSAYGDYTVDQVERNNRLANGLRRPALSAQEASAWINDL